VTLTNNLPPCGRASLFFVLCTHALGLVRRAGFLTRYPHHLLTWEHWVSWSKAIAMRRRAAVLRTVGPSHLSRWAQRTMVRQATLVSSISVQRLHRIHLLDRLLLLSAQELGSLGPSMMLALSPPTLLRPVDCRLWLHKWMAWRPSAQAQQLRCAHACSNARVRVPCKRAAHLHASEKALGPAAACARERCREIACICA
jgi:hypothetical protein